MQRIAARLGLDEIELGMLVAFCGVSLAVLVPLLTRGRPLSGSDGLFPADQLQYFAWMREAAHHVLIGNRFDLAPGDRPFFHPGFFVTGIIARITGISLPVVYIVLWKPIAIGTLFYGIRRYVRRLLPEGSQRHVGLALALFAVMPACAIVAWTHLGGRPKQYTFDFISGEMWTGQYLWGYLFTGVAVGLMPFVLLAAERWREGRGSTRTLVFASLGTFTIMYLQPWQGATVCGIVIATEAWRWWRAKEKPRWGLAWIVVAGLIPTVYYFALSHYDKAWELAGKSNAAGAQPVWSWPWWAMVLTVLPLAVPALRVYREKASDWQTVALRLWPFVALAVFLQPGGTFPYHSFQGLVIPLSIMAVQGVVLWRPKIQPRWVVLALALMILPGFAHKLQTAANNVHAGADPYFIFPSEQKALDVLEHDPRPGGVRAPLYAGCYFPFSTGRDAFVGALSLSPNFRERRTNADALFEGRLTGAPALAFVKSTHARFLFADCRKLTDLTALLKPILARVDRYGCATIYELKLRPDMLAAAGKSGQ